MEDISLQSRIDVLTQQQRMIQDSAMAFVAKDPELRNVRLNRFKQPGFDRTRWTDIAQMGWLGFLIPEAYGGMGLGFADLHPVLIQLGKGLVPVPFCSTAVLAARTLIYGANEDFNLSFLPALVNAQWRPALAWQESPGQLVTGQPQTRLRHGKLTGTKIFVADPCESDALIVPASTEAEMGLYVVDRNAQGLSVEYTGRVDGGFYGTVKLDNVAPQHLIATGTQAESAVDRALDDARCAVSAELLGVMTRALEMTLDYMKQRTQFGRPIGSFQALQHRAVDLFIQSEISRSVLLNTLGKFDDDVAPRTRAMAACQVKARCSEAALEIGRQAIQLHGAIGYTDEANIGLYLKRAMVLGSWLGAAPRLRARYARYRIAHEE